MRRILTDLAGRRIARFVALLYLVGCILPSVALAFADGAVTAYCFEDIAEIATSHTEAHVHSDGAVHHHADNHGMAHAAEQGEHTGTVPQSHSHDSNCCGLFGFTAVLPISIGATDELTTYHVQPLVLTECLVGCDPSQIDRPPIVSLSM
jgi:hypothetical protein